MRIQTQSGEVCGPAIPAGVRDLFSIRGQAETVAAPRLTNAAQLRQARLEAIRMASEEGRAWMWLAISAAGAIGISFWLPAG